MNMTDKAVGVSVGLPPSSGFDKLFNLSSNLTPLPLQMHHIFNHRNPALLIPSSRRIIGQPAAAAIYIIQGCVFRAIVPSRVC